MKLLFVLMLFFFSLNTIAQRGLTSEEKKLISYDYLNHTYKYLDNDFAIQIDSTLFCEKSKEFNLIEGRVKNYQDSLALIMKLEFENPIQQRAARSQICFSWKRLGYYLWKSEAQSRELEGIFNETAPYRIYKRMKTANDPIACKALKDLRAIVKKELPDCKIDTLAPNLQLRFALRNNPQRIKDYNTLKAQRQGGCKGNCKCSCKDKK